MKKYRYLQSAEEYLKSGIDRYELKDYKGSLSDFTLALELNPKYSEAFFYRGLIYGKEFHKYQKALKDFDKAIKYNPEYAEAYLNRGVTYRILDDLKHAVPDWRKARDLGMKDAVELIAKYERFENS